MLHLRLITPSGRTDDAVRLIEKTVGTAHVVVLPGAARNPAGDVVMCDVAREAGDELITGLQQLGIEQTGSIAVENIDLSLSKRADKAEAEAPGEGADAVLWEQLADATHEESTLSITYVAFITLATMIAACGVVLDNAILIVGAMAVGPGVRPTGRHLHGDRAARTAARASLADRAAGRFRRRHGGDGRLQPGFMDAVSLFSEVQAGRRAAQHRLHLPARLVLLRRRRPGRHRRHPLADLGEVGRPGRRRDLGHHGPGGRERSRGLRLRRVQARPGAPPSNSC